MILAGVCIVTAAFFVWRGNFDAAFVIAALGLVAWFLNYRAQLREIIVTANLQEDSKDQEERSENSNHK